MNLRKFGVILSSGVENGRSAILRAIQFIQCRNFVDEMSSVFQGERCEPENTGPFTARVCIVRTDMAHVDFRRFIECVEKRLDMSVKIHIVSNSQDAKPDDLQGVLNVLIKQAPGIRLENAGQGADLKLEKDVQQEIPNVSVSLGRVGITNIEKIIRMKINGRTSLFYAQLDLFADLPKKQSGVHMSRFREGIERLVEEITMETSPSIEAVAERLAKQITLDQGARRSEVRIKAKFPLRKITPLSGKSVEELYDFIGIAACNCKRVRKIVGVEVSGMTACPCAQEMARNHSVKMLLDHGYGKDEASRIANILPAVSHNQRGVGVLLVGGDYPVHAEHLVHIVEASMSSETYGLLKRPDEFYVVEKAHDNPMFAEDVAREMVRNLVLAYPDLPDDSFLLARQENMESIHAHNAFAELSGEFGPIRDEMLGKTDSSQRISLQEWLQFRDQSI